MNCKCPHCHGTGIDPEAYNVGRAIVAMVVSEHGLNPEHLCDLDRFWKWRTRFEARWHAAYELVRAGFTRVTAAKLLGYSQHCSVIYACRQWEKLNAIAGGARLKPRTPEENH